MSEEKREYTFKPYDELTFTDGFMFYLAMQDEEICKGVIDIDNLKHGQPYSKLKESIIIFIATKDLLGYGRARYTFSNICHEDKNIELNDKTLKVIYNLLKIASVQFLKSRISDSCKSVGWNLSNRHPWRNCSASFGDRQNSVFA